MKLFLKDAQIFITEILYKICGYQFFYYTLVFKNYNTAKLRLFEF